MPSRCISGWTAISITLLERAAGALKMSSPVLERKIKKLGIAY